MIAFHGLRRTILFGMAGAVSMAILLPGLALLRDTTGHDWYAAGKLVVTEAMIAVGFDPSALTEYRAADGSIRTVTRFRLAHTVEAWMARSHILSTIADNALLGAGAGFGGVVLMAILSSVTGGGRHGRMSRALAEPMHRECRGSSHRGSGTVEVVPHTEGGTRIALPVTPAEFDRPSGAVRQAGRAPLLTAREPGRNSTKDTSRRRAPDATSADQQTDAESPGPASSPTSNPSDTRKPPEESAEAFEPASGRDCNGVSGSDSKRPGPDDDWDWF
ncbi:MAG: hypothetical protein OXI07_09715 [Gammaproteobacteria bacterium]|nr:hypothetical protein [Gammaproteobacteria bacterium]